MFDVFGFFFLDDGDDFMKMINDKLNIIKEMATLKCFFSITLDISQLLAIFQNTFFFSKFFFSCNLITFTNFSTFYDQRE